MYFYEAYIVCKYIERYRAELFLDMINKCVSIKHHRGITTTKLRWDILRRPYTKEIKIRRTISVLGRHSVHTLETNKKLQNFELSA